MPVGSRAEGRNRVVARERALRVMRGSLPRSSRSVVSLATVAVLLFGGFRASASPQPACSGEGNWPGCDGGEGRAISPDVAPPESPEVVAPDGSARPRVLPWRVWPDPRPEWPRDGWTMEGRPFIGPDGRTCWPHGDHFHCR
jgi:hypothetical protein